jgi:hypothetical protein
MSTIPQLSPVDPYAARFALIQVALDSLQSIVGVQQRKIERLERKEKTNEQKNEIQTGVQS